MMNELIQSSPAASPPARALPPLSAEGMAKATRLLGTLAPVTDHTRVIAPADCDRIIAAVDDQTKPCTQQQASGFVARLIFAYPGLALAGRTPGEERDFQRYTVKLHEAFSVFSYPIGEAIVHGGTGVPAAVAYKPQPSDIVAFGKKEMEKLRTVKAMAMRHLAEAKRRAEAVEQERKYQHRISPERINQLLGSLRAMPINEPVAPRMPGFRPSEELLADLEARKAQRLAGEHA